MTKKKSRLPIPQNANHPNQSATLIKREVRAFSGPLPPPAALAEYDQILPGSANRILTMAETQATHRQLLERTAIFGDTARAKWGLALGFVVAIVALAASTTLVLFGHELVGGIIGAVDIIGLASVFVYATESRKAERRGKAPQVDKPRKP